MTKTDAQIETKTKEDMRTISEIADRALTLPWPDMPTKLDILMDIATVHEKTPLRLYDLYAADPANFAHDIGGIRRHLNRETLELEDCFMPRFLAR